jgi:hypothetical protein
MALQVSAMSYKKSHRKSQRCHIKKAIARVSDGGIASVSDVI